MIVIGTVVPDVLVLMVQGMNIEHAESYVEKVKGRYGGKRDESKFT